MNWKTIPNFVTVLGFVATFGYGYAFLSFKEELILPLLLTASLTDFLDGALARSLNQRSRMGTFLDPIRDKVLLVAVLLNLIMIYGREITALIVAITILEVGGGVLNFLKGLPQPVHPVGKVRGFVHFLCASTIISSSSVHWPTANPQSVEWLIYPMFLASLFALIAYTFFNRAPKPTS
ncbi:MAG: CDP-alcohol phosphatidyltransferase family protein [Candidatus Liptonbacteria bacterium]|nr:CDP-alcohol phosphatidyltransferase family protein [Candidatus Liptonbacteria bacterium]